MVEYVKQYYESEKNLMIAFTAVGVAFLFIAWLLTRLQQMDVNRGLLYTLIVLGILLLSSLGGFYSFDKKSRELNSISQTDHELHTAEVHRIKKALASGYFVSGIIASVLIIAGITLVHINPNNLLRGIGLGILIFGTTLHAIDYLSINNSKKYYDRIIQLKFK